MMAMARADIFGLDTGEAAANPYRALGYPRNPFRPLDEDDPSDAPLYTNHIESQLREIGRWVQDIRDERTQQPLSLVGTIGTGKTRILYLLQHRLAAFSPAEKAAVERVQLADTGYSRASFGVLLLAALERTRLPAMSDVPEGIMPLLWAIAVSPTHHTYGDGLLGQTLTRLHAAKNQDREELARLVTRWLYRNPLTPAQAERVGLFRRIDWEGELARVLAMLLRFADESGVLRKFFLLVDQLEELFRPTFSELRRARILTDLRGLIDDIDYGVPIGLVLAWSPDFSGGAPRYRGTGEVDVLFQDRYDALFSRLQRRRVVLPPLRRDDAEPFAQTWVEALAEEPGFDRNRQPNLGALSEAAWARLSRESKLFPGGGGGATPRDLLTELAREVDSRVGA